MSNDSITPITEDEFITISTICVPLNIISLISTVTSCVIFGFIQIYYPKFADRVSFRLSFAALFCDIGYSCHLLVILAGDDTPDVSILYCAIVVIMVIRKLKSVAKKVDYSLSTSQSSSYPGLVDNTVISSVVKRVMWYPVVPLVAQFFSSFVEIYAYINRVVYYPLYLLCFIGMSLQGLLNALVFSQDIAVTRTFQDVKLQWWISNVNSYEFHYPHRSHSKAITDEFCMLERSNDFVELKPSFLEWIKYMLLIKLFSPPESSSRLISPKLLSHINSLIENKPINTSSALFGKNNSKQNITLNNQNNNQEIHLVFPEPVHLENSFQYPSIDLSSQCLNPTTSSDPLIGRINSEPIKRVSGEILKIFGPDTDLSQEIEMYKQTLKKL
ncbi:18702_t:CDS:2 [Dentiscutata erythropus]|uniref:18702_t:CDS:1 n=1 Tax=Dentiscutata erythropus TaxID=1348616 RepID=A0A9N8VXV0_9GLOM|nr:18702_t:CDS:2 [Dentiscutata erythropus]